MKKYTKSILAVVIFLFFQFLGGIIVSAFALIFKPKDVELTEITTNPALLAFIIILTGLLTVLTCWKGLKMIKMCETFSTKRLSWGIVCLAFVAAIAGIFATDLLSEQFDLPNLLEETMVGMANSFWGVLAVAIIGPIVEELVFREGILGNMLRNGVAPWTAMIVSALLFGLIHMNPAQVPFAAIMGLLLAIIYYKTGNIIITSLIHIFNNSLALLEMRLLGENVYDFSYTEWIGGQKVAIVCIIVATALCIILMKRFWQNVKEPVYVPEPVIEETPQEFQSIEDTEKPSDC